MNILFNHFSFLHLFDALTFRSFLRFGRIQDNCSKEPSNHLMSREQIRIKRCYLEDEKKRGFKYTRQKLVESMAFIAECQLRCSTSWIEQAHRN